jgi:hypothetical protein
MATAKRHVHKYHQVNIAGTPTWACGRPDCNHYMPSHMTALVVGKASICWTCANQIILDLENMKDEKPICRTCKHGDMEDFISSISRESEETK